MGARQALRRETGACRAFVALTALAGPAMLGSWGSRPGRLASTLNHMSQVRQTDRSASPPAAAAVLDERALQALADLDPGGHGGLVPRVLRTYLASMARLLEELRAHRTAQDLSGLRHVAHTLKSSSASIGALVLSRLCADVERRVRENDLDGLEAALQALTDESAQVVQAVSAMLRE